MELLLKEIEEIEEWKTQDKRRIKPWENEKKGGRKKRWVRG